MKSLLVVLLVLSQSIPTVKYDPKRNAADDIKSAAVEAQRTGSQALLGVAGEWCSWCPIMDRYFEEHSQLRELRDKSYVLVKINFSPENENSAVLSQYPKISGYPHIFILDSDGKFLYSEATNQLEEGHSYNLD